MHYKFMVTAACSRPNAKRRQDAPKRLVATVLRREYRLRIDILVATRTQH